MKILVLGLLMSVAFTNNSFAQAVSASDALELTLAANTLPKVKGVVRRVDLANSSITLKADEIPNLDMPAMTMPFSVQDPAMLNGLAPGDNVLFSAQEINGNVTIVWMETQP